MHHFRVADDDADDDGNGDDDADGEDDYLADHEDDKHMLMQVLPAVDGPFYFVGGDEEDDDDADAD
eukprot:6613968-Pyramimonas_sp.AAC.1